jgi:PAS domain S-box-containing protein
MDILENKGIADNVGTIPSEKGDPSLGTVAQESTTSSGQARSARPWAVLRHWLLANTFAPSFLPGKWAHPFFGYLVALLLQAIAVTITALLIHAFPSFHFVGALALVVVLFVALIWGAGPSLLATLAGALLMVLFILPSYFSLVIAYPEDLLGMFLYLAVGLIISILASAERRVRQGAAEQVSQLAAVFDAITDHVLVYDREGQLIKFNESTRQFNELVGHPDYTKPLVQDRLSQYGLRDEQGQSLSQEQWPIFRILQGEVLKSANAEDVLLSLPDGREVQLSVTGSPIRDKQGHLVGGVIICRDVTERRQLEQRTHEVLEALLAMAQVAVQEEEESDDICEHTTSAAQLTAQRLAELTREVLGCQRLGITTVEPETELLRPFAVVGLTPAQEQQWWAEQQQQEIHLSDGPDPSLVQRLRNNEVLLLDMTQPPYSDQPNPYGVRSMLAAPMCIGSRIVGLLTLDYGGADHRYTPEELQLAGAVATLAALVIERERLLHERAEARANELALRAANQQMDIFLGIASHELRTPLTTIKGNIQLAKRQVTRYLQGVPGEENTLRKKLEDVHTMLERAERQVGVQNRLVSDLLDVSRMQENKLELRMAPCDLAVLVREAVEDQRLSSPARIIRLEGVDTHEVPIIADADRIRQVLSNYLVNALKYSSSDRSVEVRVHARGAQACVAVRDEGPGLSPFEQERIWDRFYRVEGIDVQSGAGVGLGLGLYICRTVIEQHQGEVGIESAPGQGSTFWFTLPIQEQTDLHNP